MGTRSRGVPGRGGDLMGLIFLGSVDAASDATMATVTGQPGSLFRGALAGLISAILSQNQTVIDAAVAAVEVEIQSTGDGRLSDTGGSVGANLTYTDLDTIPAWSGWYKASATALNRPPVGSAISVFQMAYSATYRVQIAVPVDGTAAATLTYVRVQRAGVWRPWEGLVTESELNARIAGLVAELDLVTFVKCVHLEAGKWVWDGPDGPLATHYLIPDETGALIARPTPFPTPSASSPELTW